MTIYRETSDVSIRKEFETAKEILNSTNTFAVPYAIVKPGVLFKKEENSQAFFPVFYISGRNVNLDDLREKFCKEKIATIERSENFDYVVSSNCKIRDFVPLVKKQLLEHKEIPDMEILFLPEKSKTVIYFLFLNKNDEKNAAFFANFIKEIPHKAESL